MAEDRENILELIDEEGTEHDFEVMDIFNMEGTDYAVLRPLDDPDFAGSDDMVIMRIEQDENGEEVLSDIEDDEEWEKVVDFYDENYFEYDE